MLEIPFWFFYLKNLKFWHDQSKWKDAKNVKCFLRFLNIVVVYVKIGKNAKIKKERTKIEKRKKDRKKKEKKERKKERKKEKKTLKKIT